ncbi:cytochrome P450 [Streptomyces olivoreticuli]|uniref:cytochrome P450 n=1 Tax=Streptomyces olivoreticuli TaxID=68246 RepID=UPI00265947C3|nr:cytochrome P450 [Streptomyces olivoreticuli]WKK23940.1 cytochrome P450 [Streptomyces olivoreticuli]
MMTNEARPRISVTADFWDHLPFDVRGEAFLADPYPFYETLRTTEPVTPFAGGGVLAVTGYHAALAVLGDRRFGLGDGALESQSFVLVDPPEHRRRRARVSGPFTARAVERLRPMIRHRTAALVSAAAVRGEVEVVADLAVPLALELICALVGVPLEDRAQWYGALPALSFGFTPAALLDEESLARLTTARLDFARYLGALIEDRRRAPRDDLVSALVAPGADGTVLTDQEVITGLGQLIVAGYEPTVHQMANGLYALLRHPGQLARLRTDPSCVPAAVEEALRYDPVLQVIARIALQDADIGGRPIAAGTVVGILAGAANRDPEVFPDGHRLDITRSPHHLTLGHGEHFCLGAHLARVQAEALFSAVARCRPVLTGEPVRYRPQVFLREVERLPVVLTERAAEED